MSIARILFRTGILNDFSFQSGKFHTSCVLMAEPLKKKKRIDPAVVKAREEKRKRRIEKMIRRLEKTAKQLKPIDENEVPIEIIKEKTIRAREKVLSENILNERMDLLKQWSIYKLKTQLADIKMCDRIVLSQQWALDELKNESLDLYNAAIQIDDGLIPFCSKGPVETPPIRSYESPDGEFVDISKKWDH